MNEQLQQALAAILNKTMSGVDAGVNFLSAEIPDVVHQLLLWKIASAGIGLLFILALLIVGAVAGVKGLRTISERSAASNRYTCSTGEEEKLAKEALLDSEAKEPLAWVKVVFALIAWTLAPWQGYTYLMLILKIWIAPKIYLIEYAASLVK